MHGSAHRVAAVAVRGRAWLWRSLPASAAASRRASLDAANAPGWWHGRDLEERMSVLGAKSTAFLQRWLSKMWTDLSVAPPGSLKHYMHRGATAVLAREDPNESFFKSLPSRDAPLSIEVPENVPLKLARRRLRLLAGSRASAHRRGLALWALSVPPQIPLLALPLPNVTIYYSVYRAWSHARALQGIRTLRHAIEDLDARQLAEHMRRMQELSGGKGQGKEIEGEQGNGETATTTTTTATNVVADPGAVLMPSRLERLAEAIHLRRISRALRARRLRERDESLFKTLQIEVEREKEQEQEQEQAQEQEQGQKSGASVDKDGKATSTSDQAAAAAKDAGLAPTAADGKPLEPVDSPSSPPSSSSSRVVPSPHAGAGRLGSPTSSRALAAAAALTPNELLGQLLATPPELWFEFNRALPVIASGASELAPEDVRISARALGDGGFAEAVKKVLDRQRKVEKLPEASGWDLHSGTHG